MRSVSSRKTTFLPAGIREFLRRRLIEAAGLFFALLAAALGLALFSYAAADPSLNSAGDGPIANWLGPAGAMAADFLLQTIGLASLLLVPLLLAWSWRILLKRGIGRFWMRLALLPFALLGATLAATSFASPGRLAAGRRPRWVYRRPSFPRDRGP